jgi:hypothetical protein
VASTPLARALHETFGIAVGKDDQATLRLAFRTGSEETSTGSGGRSPLARRGILATLAPSPVHLRLELASRPRNFVSVLLGGRDNRWPNVTSERAGGSPPPFPNTP